MGADVDLPVPVLQDLVAQYRAIVTDQTGSDFPRTRSGSC